MTNWRLGARFIWELFKREQKSRYAGSLFGLISFFTLPVLNIAIYVFIFSVIFEARIPRGLEQRSFVIFLCAGLIPWMVFSETVSRALGLFNEFAVILRKIHVSVFVLLGYLVLHGIVLFLIYLLTFFCAVGLTSGAHAAVWVMNATILIPLLFVYLVPVILFVSVTSVYIADMRTYTPVILQLLFWLTPIVYSLRALPIADHPWVTQVMLLNPVYGLISSFQDIIFFETLPQPNHIVHALVWAAVFAVVSSLYYRANRDTLIDRI